MRSRLPAAAVIGLLGALAGGAALLGVDSAPISPTGAASVARFVLAEATVPPGGQPTRAIRTPETSTLGGWGTTPGVEGLVGAHAFYLYDEPPAAVADYIETHLPPGAVLTHYGNPFQSATEVTEWLPVSGPDEYMATLTYQVAGTNAAGTRSELRIDSKTVWVPLRPPTERAPTAGIIRVVGYTQGGRYGSQERPVEATASGARAHAILRAFDSLPLGPRSADCFEQAEYFQISDRHHAGQASALGVFESSCGNYVGVSENGEGEPALSDRSCALLAAVAAALPDRARITKAAAADCTHRPSNPSTFSPPKGA